MKFRKGEKVDLLSPSGARQRAIVLKTPTGKRGPGAMPLLKVTSSGHFPRGEIFAHNQFITGRRRPPGK
jgi:hypothetical protein